MKDGISSAIVLVFQLHLSNVLPGPCSVAFVDSQIKTLYESLLCITERDGRLRAEFIRRGFHDWATTTTSKPYSGCNGSLRNEGASNTNARLGKKITVVTLKVNEIVFCVSYPNAFMIAYAAAVKTATGVSTVSLIVDSSKTRLDAENGETDADNQNKLQLLSGGSTDFSQLWKFYTDRKMTVMDMITSIAIGHSLGSVRSKTLDALFPVKHFTAVLNRGGPFYTTHLLWRFETMSARELKVFLTLLSDRTLVSDPRGNNIFKTYARYQLLGSEEEP